MAKDKNWKGGKGIKGTVRAAITHHPDKFDADCKDPGKLCPYAIFSAMKKKGFESHYKDQKSTLKGTPKKKAKFKDKKESDYYSFKDYCDFREQGELVTFILWGESPSRLKYSGKVGGGLWDQFIVNAKGGKGYCYLVDAVNVQDAKNKAQLAKQTSSPFIFVHGNGAATALGKFGMTIKESLSHGDCKYCDSRIHPETGDQIHSVDCPKYKEWYRKRIIAGRTTSG